MNSTTITSRVDFKRLVGALVASAYFAYCTLHPTLGHFIDYVDLVIHEAGHIVFIFFGEFIHILGGSLLQVLIPVIFSLYFYLRRDHFSGSLLLLWVGYNIVNVSIYARDSIVMQLPLLGGDNVIHDWNYLLTSTGMLSHTYVIANSLYAVGILTMIAGAVICIEQCFKPNPSV